MLSISDARGSFKSMFVSFLQNLFLLFMSYYGKQIRFIYNGGILGKLASCFLTLLWTKFFSRLIEKSKLNRDCHWANSVIYGWFEVKLEIRSIIVLNLKINFRQCSRTKHERNKVEDSGKSEELFSSHRVCFFFFFIVS